MAAGPVTGNLARGIIDQLVGGGRAGSPLPQPSGSRPPEMASSMLNSQLSELRQADPQAVQRALTEMKKQIVQLIPQVAFTIPGMNKHLPNLLKTVEAALKEVEQAANTMAATGGQQPQANPIQSSIARPTDGAGSQPAAGSFPF